MQAGRSGWWVLGVALVALVMAWPTQAQAQRRGGDGYLKRGAVGSRLGAGLFSVQTIETDGQGNVIGEDSSLGLSVLGGLSYALHERLALDFDAALLFGFEPELTLLQTELVPGARLFVLPSLYGRAAYAVRVQDPTNQLGLLGAGFYVSRSSLSVFIELNYVVYSEKEVDSKIIPRIGVELAF